MEAVLVYDGLMQPSAQFIHPCITIVTIGGESAAPLVWLRGDWETPRNIIPVFT
jgi:hypothetical protein